MDALLKDPKTTTVRLVTNAEKIVIKETQRAFMYFGLYGFTVDAVIVNRLLPEGVHDPFFDKWRKTQGVFLEEARGYFDPGSDLHAAAPGRPGPRVGGAREPRAGPVGREGPRGLLPLGSVRIATRRGTGSTSSRSTCRSSTGARSISRWRRETSS